MKYIPLALAFLAIGCAAGPRESGTMFVAIDTSDSAAGQKGAFYNATLDGLMALPMNSSTVVYRFDAKPAEIHSGPPPESTEEAAKLLKRAVQYRTDTPGTNLAKLVQLIDGRLPEAPAPIDLRLFTDCGIELMTEAEKEKVKRTTIKWSHDSRVRSVTFYGVRDGYREELRRMVRLGPDKFAFEEL
jgi:hypothetical protein